MTACAQSKPKAWSYTGLSPRALERLLPLNFRQRPPFPHSRQTQPERHRVQEVIPRLDFHTVFQQCIDTVLRFFIIFHLKRQLVHYKFKNKWLSSYHNLEEGGEEKMHGVDMHFTIGEIRPKLGPSNPT